ncbi:hypothetical protein [Flammeovirga sp. EKP202]|uniref:hypothetical protein n=1 Tax=Flammeovirga sp. EKP202 TaxID=2770592 RepID=UPI00165F27C7|nr:hypothetical protein [Flammeovirga sp. EKP202]MBD0400275.1 hypothetical protein [Flammeovirga sp. EKP202]
MTLSIQNNIDEQQIIKSILQNDLKKKKWLKASKWLKTQMIKWEIENNNAKFSSLVFAEK